MKIERKGPLNGLVFALALLVMLGGACKPDDNASNNQNEDQNGGADTENGSPPETTPSEQATVVMGAEGRLPNDLELSIPNGAAWRLAKNTMVVDEDGLPLEGQMELVIQSLPTELAPVEEEVEFIDLFLVTALVDGVPKSVEFIAESEDASPPVLRIPVPDPVEEGGAHAVYFAQEIPFSQFRRIESSLWPTKSDYQPSWRYLTMLPSPDEGIGHIDIRTSLSGLYSHGIMGSRSVVVDGEHLDMKIIAQAPFRPVLLKLVEEETAEMLCSIEFSPLDSGPRIMGPQKQLFKVWLGGADGRTVTIRSRFGNLPMVMASPALGEPFVRLDTTGPFVMNNGEVRYLLEKPYIDQSPYYAGALHILVMARSGSFSSLRRDVVNSIQNACGSDCHVQVDWYRASGAGYVAGVRVDTYNTGLFYIDHSGPVIVDVTEREQRGRLLIIRIEKVWEDPDTGLMWQNKIAECGITQSQAVEYCRLLEWEGYSDWRLPSISELRSLFREEICRNLSPGGSCGVYDDCNSYLECWDEEGRCSWYPCFVDIESHEASTTYGLRDELMNGDGCNPQTYGVGLLWSSVPVSDDPGHFWMAEFGFGGSVTFRLGSDSHRFYGATCVR